MKLIHSLKTHIVALAVGGAALNGLVAHATTYVWTNSVAGSWNTAASWSPNGVPGAADTATITNASASVFLSGTASAGTIILGNSGGGAALLSLNGQTLTLSGPLTVNAGGQFAMDSGALVGNTNAVLSGSGLINWVGGSLGGVLTLASGSTMNIVFANNHDMPNCIFTNNGTVVWNNGTIRSGGSGTTIYNYGLWDAQSDQVLTTGGYGGTAVFNNYGTLRKSGGASEFADATLFQSVVFNQLAGVLDVQNGTNGLEVAFQGGGNFTGGFITTNSQGLTVLNAGNFTINGTVTGTNTWQDVGNLVGVNVIKGALTWVGGTWNGTTAVTVTTNSTLIIIGNGGYNDMANTVVTNNGAVKWASGTIRSGGSGTTIYNYGLWDAQSDQVLTTGGYGGTAVFNNYGTLRKSGGASEFANATLFQSVVFNQLAGMIDVQNGTNGLEVAFQGGGNFTGGFITTNKFGLTVLGAGSFNVNGTVTGTNTWQDIGNLVGTNIIKGALTWVGGLWNGAVVTITTNSTVIVAGGGGLNDMNAAVVANYGTLTWASGQIRGGDDATVYNYGLWDAQSDQQLNSAYGGATTFNNFGTFRKSGGVNPAVNTLIAGNVLFNQPSGVLDVQLGNVVLQGGANFTGGYITTNSTGTTYFSIGSFNLNGTATGSNVVENSGNLVGVNVIKGALNWVAGNWNGTTVTILPGSIVTVSGGGGLNDMANCTLTNNGTVAWASGQIRGGSGTGTFIYNYGLWDAQSDQQLNDAYGVGTVFNNFGTVRKSAGTGNTLFAGGVLFNQPSGLLSVLKGNVLLQGSGNFTGGSISNSNGAATYLNAGSFNINGTITLGNVIENAGILVGTNVINGNLTWVAGNWNGATVAITTNSTVTIAGGGGLNDMANTMVTNYGTVVWASGQIRGGSGAGTFIDNYGLWDAQSDQQMNDAYGVGTVFNNYGTFRKEFTSGSTVFVGGVTFNNTGKMDAQDGNISLQGAYTLANGTKMGFGLGGWLGNGSISLSGAASFSGSVSVNINGYFWPVVGSSFNLLNYTSESGVLFTNTTLPPPFTWQTNYNATAFAISVISRPAFTNTASTNLFSSVINPTNLYLAWPGDHTGWRLQSQTNTLNVGINTNWTAVAGSSVTNEFFMPIVKTNSTVFYRMIYP